MSVRTPDCARGASPWPSRRAFYRELLEDPSRVQVPAAPVAVADRHVVARARVQRQAPFGRIPPVVLIDQLVEVVEAPVLRQVAPVRRKLPRVVSITLPRPLVCALQTLAVTVRAGLDLLRALDEARHDAGLQVLLDRRHAVQRAACDPPFRSVAAHQISPSTNSTELPAGSRT